MAKQEKKLSFTFVNPNDSGSFEKHLRRILIDRLISAHKQQAMAS